MIEQRLAEFKADLIAYDPLRITRKYILTGDPFIIDGAKYVELKEAVASQFNIHPSEVYMVGSGKMGFSIKPTKRYCCFGDRSDIDLAIVSRDLFEKTWNEVHCYFESSGWWEKSTDFKNYLFHGWIRPDKFPSDSSFTYCKTWWEFFRELTATEIFGRNQIKAGIYYSMSFLESYQRICIDQCKRGLEL